MSTETILTEKPVTPPETKVEPKVSADGNIVEMGDKKYIIDAALHQEREAHKELKASVDAMKPLMPQFEAFLKEKDAREKATVSRGADADGDYPADQLEGLAIVRGYMKDDGVTPDTARAKQDLDLMMKPFERMLTKAIKPITDTVARSQADLNREKAKTRVFDDGRPVADAAYLEKAMNAVPPEYLQDPQTAMMVEVLAAGLQSLDERRTGKTHTRKEPIMREGTSRFESEESGGLTPFDRAAARARGLSDEDYAKKQKAINDPKHKIDY